MQEVNHVNDYLYGGKRKDYRSSGIGAAKGFAHDEPERNRCQQDRRKKTRRVTTQGQVGDTTIAMPVRAAAVPIPAVSQAGATHAAVANNIAMAADAAYARGRTQGNTPIK